jgi:hypothetical protein
VFSFHLRISAAGRLGVLVLGLANSGCSFIFVTPPPPRAEQASLPNAECTSGRAGPVIDGIITGLEVVRTVFAVQASGSEEVYRNGPLSREADIAAGVGFTGLFLGSAIYGAIHTTECRNFKERIPPVTPAPPPVAPASNGAAPSPSPSPAPPTAPPPTAPPAAAPSPFTAVPRAQGAPPP